MAYPSTLDNLTDPNGATTLGANGHAALHAAANAVIEALEAKLGTDTGALELGATQKARWAASVFISSGAGSPEGVVTAPVGSLYLRNNGSTASTLYIKESGAGNTGWVGAGTGGSGMSPTLFNAQTILAAVTDDTPVAVTIAVDQVVGRITGGNIASLYPYIFPYTINAQTGTTYTTVLGDVGVFITATNAAAVVVTIPANATVAYPVGTILTIVQGGAGQVTLAPAGGVAISSSASLKTRAQYSTIQLLKTAVNTWILFGDTEPIGQNINGQTGTTYTFVLSDADDFVTFTNASAITATIPTNASVAFPIGTQIDIAQLGAGQVTVAAAGGVTLQASAQLKLRAQYAGGTLKKRATDTWLLVGDLTP